MGPFVILGAKERKSTWGDKKKMVNQFTDFEIFEEEYYDFADFLALELSDQSRKDRDNKKLRMSRRYRVPNFFIKSSEKISLGQAKRAQGKRIEKEFVKNPYY